MHHQVATAGKLGRLTPFCIQEIAPGDTVSGKVGLLTRLSPLKRAIVQDLYIDQAFVYVPHRLVYADWEAFLAEGPLDSPTYTMPSVTVSAGTNTHDSLFWPSHATEDKSYSALRLNAYLLAFNEYWRDQQDAIVAPGTDPGEFGLQVSYKKDYWTTLRDALQIGPAQTVASFSESAPGDPHHHVVPAVDILRAIAQQKIAMKRATYGTRYVDILRSYGINVNYQMLQRPEVVATARSTVNVTDVVASSDTSASSPGSPLGALAGHGISGDRLTIRRKTFPEHGTLLGLMVIRPPQMLNGLCDWFDRARRYTSFYDPGLVPLPPQSVVKRDIKNSVANATANDIIGYQTWGQWYRGSPSKVHPLLFNGDWVSKGDLPQAGGWNPDDVRNMPIQANLSDVFADTTYGDFQVSAVNALKFLRLIPKANSALVTGMGG